MMTDNSSYNYSVNDYNPIDKIHYVALDSAQIMNVTNSQNKLIIEDKVGNMYDYTRNQGITGLYIYTTDLSLKAYNEAFPYVTEIPYYDDVGNLNWAPNVISFNKSLWELITSKTDNLPCQPTIPIPDFVGDDNNTAAMINEGYAACIEAVNDIFTIPTSDMQCLTEFKTMNDITFSPVTLTATNEQHMTCLTNLYNDHIPDVVIASAQIMNVSTDENINVIQQKLSNMYDYLYTAKDGVGLAVYTTDTSLKAYNKAFPYVTEVPYFENSMTPSWAPNPINFNKSLWEMLTGETSNLPCQSTIAIPGFIGDKDNTATMVNEGYAACTETVNDLFAIPTSDKQCLTEFKTINMITGAPVTLTATDEQHSTCLAVLPPNPNPPTPTPDNNNVKIAIAIAAGGGLLVLIGIVVFGVILGSKKPKDEGASKV